MMLLKKESQTFLLRFPNNHERISYNLLQKILTAGKKKGLQNYKSRKPEFEKLIEPMKIELARISEKNESMSRDRQSLGGAEITNGRTFEANTNSRRKCH